MAQPIRVLLVDDHPLIRQGIQRVLAVEDDIVVAGEAGDGSEALTRARELHPDVVLLDISMPRGNGIEAARLLLAEMPGVRVLFLTIHDDEEYLREAVRVGASGFLLKDVEPRELVRALRLVARGGTYLDPTLGGRLMKDLEANPALPGQGALPEAPDRTDGETGSTGRSYAAAGGPTAAYGPAFASLTARERQVLTLLAEGASNREIGNRLFITEKTVKKHMSSILQKIGASDRLQAVLLALRAGEVKVGRPPER